MPLITCPWPCETLAIIDWTGDAWGSALLDAVTQGVLMEDSEKGNYSKGILGTGDTIIVDGHGLCFMA